MEIDFVKIFQSVINLMNETIYLIIGVAVFGFLWGVLKMLFSSDNEIAKKEGRSFMMYGILTIFVMTSFWGLVNILNGTLVLDEGYKGDINYDKDGINNSTGDAQMI